MKYILVIIFIATFNLTTINAQIEVGFKTGIQMLGMFRHSASIFGDGQKVFNPAYGINIGHKIGENLDLSLDVDFTSGNYHNLAQNKPFKNSSWKHANYSLVNTSVLVTYIFRNGIGIRSGFHIFFVGEITTEYNITLPLVGPDRVLSEFYDASRTIGIPFGITKEINRFELELKWVGSLKKYFSFERGYRRLETLSINLFYNFSSEK